MTAITRGPALPGALPLPRWAWLAAALAVLMLWTVAMEGGAISHALAGTSNYLHEFFHDGRHLLGVPCH